jgi:hypothetical protein
LKANRVGPSKKRRFTLAEANRSLPLVKRVVADIVRSHENAVALQAKLEDGVTGKERTKTQEELETLMDRLQGFVDELAEIGVELKDYSMGLVDFIGRHQARDVYLCWKLGEEQIAYWHELHTGFAGRKPVSQLDENE